MTSLFGHVDDVIELNVGGHIFSTLRSTLCKDQDSMLARKFARDTPFGPLTCDKEGRPFLDRDDTTFAIILHFLRSDDHRWLSHKVASMSLENLQELHREVMYFGIQIMDKCIKTEFLARHAKVRRKLVCNLTPLEEDEQRIAAAGKEYRTVVYDVNEDMGKAMSEWTCLQEDTTEPAWEVDRMIPVAMGVGGSVVKMCVVFVCDEAVTVSGITSPEDQRILDLASEASEDPMG